MNNPMRILGIAGSLRRASYNCSALREATRLVPDGATLDILSLMGFPASIRTRNRIHPQRSPS